MIQIREEGWSDRLQVHLSSADVVVSKLHPVMGARVDALFEDLTQAGFASRKPGEGDIQISSGVRTKAHQVRLYNDICLRQNRCEMVANPNTVHGVDAEGVQRAGSNHMEQAQDPRLGVSWGYAVDIWNRRTGMSEAERWKPVHDRLPLYGLDWPLKSNPLEPWHIEFFSRNMPGPLDGPFAWSKRPGVLRPLVRGMIGRDVVLLNEQAAARLGLPIPTPESAPHIFGPKTETVVQALEKHLGLDVDGVWTKADQEAFETPPAKPPPAEPNADLLRVLDQLDDTLTAAGRLAAEARGLL